MTTLAEATSFIYQFYQENNLSGVEARIQEVTDELNQKGLYLQTIDEITFGARVAWRNSNRCVGRLFWPSLHVLDARHVETESEAFEALLHHLRFATNAGKIRSTLTVFNPFSDQPIRLLNRQLIRYAGYDEKGDPMEKEFTQLCIDLGWQGYVYRDWETQTIVTGKQHRINMTCFRTCSTCGSRSQATFCHCTISTMCFPVTILGLLSVDYEYLALEDGPPIFRQDFTCPALLVASLVPHH